MLTILVHSWLKHCIALFFLTFLHEDVAIIAAAFSKVEYGLPLGYAFISLYFGVIAGDLFIYTLGRAAQKSPWLRSRIIGPRVDQVKSWLENNYIRIVAICRITPGLLFPTFVAIGWFRMPVRKLLVISLVTAAIYTPIALAIVTLLGEAVLYKLGYWAWGIILLMVLLFPVRKLFISYKKNGNRQFLNLLSNPFLEPPAQKEPERKKHHNGMPSLKGLKRLISKAERIPEVLFYTPIAVRWLFLSFRYGNFTLPTIVNPLIETGGFWGESKSATLDDVGKDYQKWLARFILFTRTPHSPETDLEVLFKQMNDAGLEFPVVVKPDIGWQGFGVRKINNKDELLDYLILFPKSEKFLVQRFIPWDGEAGIFYARIPGEPRGRVFSLTLRYFPYVVGDGQSNIQKLIMNNPRTGFKSKYYLGRDPEHVGLTGQKLNEVPAEGEMVRLAFIGSIRTGGIYRDAHDLITEALSERFDAIAQSIPEFYFGRFDIRFKSTELLKTADEFSIFEINGAGSEPIHAYDPEVPLMKIYRELFKTQDLLFRIAVANRKRGYKTESAYRFLRAVRRQNRLLRKYPPSI